MKLNFGLLWIEDSYSSQEEEEIRVGATAAGFELEVTNSKDGSDLNVLAAHQQKFHAFDLVLLDLNLAGGIQGDSLAPVVRSLFRTTPILFYSGSDTESGLRSRMAAAKIEGVFCASRGNFTARASDLIQDYAHTLNRLSGMRGLAMEVVAEVDVICRNVISTLAVDDLERVVITSLNDAVCEQSQKNLDEFPALANLSERLNHPATDSMKTFKIFRDMLKKHIKNLPNGENKDQLQSLSVKTSQYRDQVIKVRNVLGHSVEIRNDNGWLIQTRDGTPFMSVVDFPTHRSNFLVNLRAIREISRILISKE